MHYYQHFPQMTIQPEFPRDAEDSEDEATQALLKDTFRAGRRKMRYDDILQEVGQFGPYQGRSFALLCVPLAIVSLMVMSAVFTLTEPEHRCAIPGYENDTYTVQGEHHQALVNASVDPGSECRIYTEFNISEPFQHVENRSNQTQPCHRWVYDTSQVASSIITEFNLVCDKTYVRASSNMGMFAGSFVGGFTFGVLADVIGRKRTMLLTVTLGGISSLLLVFMPTVLSVIIVRCIQGMSFQMFAISFSTAMELVGPAWRTTMGMGAELVWVIGEFLVLLLAYLARDWRLIQLVLGITTFLGLLALSFTPESPRWLLDNGRYDEAEKIIKKIAASNKKTLPPGALSRDTSEEEEGPQLKIWEMFKHRQLVFRTLIIFYNWFCVNLLYYGLSLNLDNLPGNIYFKFFISCLAELFAYVLTFAVLDRLGRKNVHTASMFIGGAACLTVLVPVLYLSSEYSWLVTALAMVGKTAASVCYATLYIMTVELFPTVVRNSGIACCSIFENISGMTSPYIADLGKLVGGHLSQALPMLVFGSCALMAGALSTQLPETLGQPLPETVYDALAFGTKKKKQINHGMTLDQMKE